MIPNLWLCHLEDSVVPIYTSLFKSEPTLLEVNYKLTKLYFKENSKAFHLSVPWVLTSRCSSSVLIPFPKSLIFLKTNKQINVLKISCSLWKWPLNLKSEVKSSAWRTHECIWNSLMYFTNVKLFSSFHFRVDGQIAWERASTMGNQG